MGSSVNRYLLDVLVDVGLPRGPGLEMQLEELFEKMKKEPDLFLGHIRPQSDFIKEKSYVEVHKYPEALVNIPLILNERFNLRRKPMWHVKRVDKRDKPNLTKHQIKKIKQYYKEDYDRWFPELW